MRFIANGPSIPDELLLARDQGRVVFFCGAGVSRAKAKLPDFFELATTVTRALGVQQDDPAMKIIAEAKEIGNRTGVDGLISADRIFGLLERDFLSRDIQEAVANALKPKNSPDLSAHKTLLRLATTREGLVRLVTTNFDRLFDCCQQDLITYTPPNLPDPLRAIDFNGMVYLHGKTNSAHNGAEGDGFVLSSSEFGKAYLSEGWATSFVRKLLDRYYVIFVGYSADDPPVHYLLEALNRTSGQSEGVYAFQPGDNNYANFKWEHKGVNAIAYDDENNHAALWDTLDAWAIRADDPDAWIAKVVECAKSGPEALQPHERGQVAHVVSTVEGIRKFSEDSSPPPATWLCVFDPYRRYAKPQKTGQLSEERLLVDPFDLYSLDSDKILEKIDPENFYEKREVPHDAWDAFALSKLDRNGLRDESTGSVRGNNSLQSPRLPLRLFQLGVWISKVSGQPATVWWAVRQHGLHPEIQHQIALALEKAESETPMGVLDTWRYLFDFWSKDRGEFYHDWYLLARGIAKSGWTELLLRQFATFSMPYIKVNEISRSTIPKISEDLDLKKLIHLEVKYPDLPHNISIPDEWLLRAIVSLRRNLETALELEHETGEWGLDIICPITPENDSNGDTYSRKHGLSAWVLYFISQFERLISFDSKAAKAELSKWPSDDPTIFARLRIWTLGQPDLVSRGQFGLVLSELPDKVFWDSYHARDLLLAISSRWAELEVKTKKAIEQRLLKGPMRIGNEQNDQFRERKAWSILDRLHWMQKQGCVLQLGLVEITKKLQKEAPKWKLESAKNAARSFEGKSGWVRTETEHSALLKEPLETTLAKAKELSGRRGIDFVEYDPFAGLSQEHPERAFEALMLSAKKSEFPEWAWRTFLNPEHRKNDHPKFTSLIGEQVSTFSSAEIAGILHPLTDWIQKSAKVLATKYPSIFSALISQAIVALSHQTDENDTIINRSNENTDWATEAIISPAGKLTEALFEDPKLKGLKEQQGLPKKWLKHTESLLKLPGDLRRHALVIFAHNLSWLFFVDPKWTQSNLLSVLSSECNQDEEALWAGFFWGGKAEGRELFAILKPHMLRMAKSSNLERHGHTETLTGLLLSAWAISDKDTGKKWVSDEELRDLFINSNDDFRSRILWQTKQWAKENREKWSPLLIELFKLWPRHIAAKSGIVSARLCDIAFSDEKHFPELVALILPLLTKIDSSHYSSYLILPDLRSSRDTIVDLYPHEMLAILHAVLPDNITAWPYEIDSLIVRIGEADSNIKRDERFIELKRRWDTR